MKNTVSFLFVLLLSAFSVAAETITVKGKITNTSDGKITVRGESFFKEITLQPDGSFSEMLTINYNGSYTLITAENKLSIYLTKGTALTITADNANFYNSVLFAGKGSAENQYLAKKNLVFAAINQEELYRADETEFLGKLKEIKNSLMATFKAAKFSDPSFKEKEARSINYFEQLSLVNYPSYHAYYAKIDGYKPTAAFPKFDASIDLDNENEFLFSNAYKQLVNAKFNEAIDSKMTPEDQYTYKYALPEIKKLKSQSFKNALLKVLSFEIGPGNPDNTELYNQLVALTPNEFLKNEITEKFNKIKGMSEGKPSPTFDYENYSGGQTSLESLKGSYVYIDVWATWCGPCLQEIPSLQKVEEQYHGKNIRFVSISIDAVKDNAKWRKMVNDKKLGGIQLFAGNNRKSEFISGYAIDTIPRFILIDPSGNIVYADAPRPSDPKLIELFSNLKI